MKSLFTYVCLLWIFPAYGIIRFVLTLANELFSCYYFKEVIEFFVQNENSGDRWKKPLVIDKLKVRKIKPLTLENVRAGVL